MKKLDEEIRNAIVREAGVLYIKELEWQPNNKSFSAECSRLRSFYPSARSITVKNPKSGNKRVFNFVKEQKDNTNEDTYYWLFENTESGIKLYIWND